MDNTNIDGVIDALFNIMPAMRKKLPKIQMGETTANLSHLNFAIMRILSEDGMTTTELARTLTIKKSQMTHLINQMVEMDIVKRIPDVKDRRVINLVLTDHGNTLMNNMDQQVRKVIKDKLSGLTSKELTEMMTALETMRNIVAKL
jgi:DNA-binding MarR family transcriptional regulator